MPLAILEPQDWTCLLGLKKKPHAPLTPLRVERTNDRLTEACKFVGSGTRRVSSMSQGQPSEYLLFEVASL